MKGGKLFYFQFLGYKMFKQKEMLKELWEMNPSVLKEFQSFSLNETVVLSKTVKGYQKKRCTVLYLLHFKVNIIIPSTRIITFSHFHRDFHAGLWSSVFFLCSFLRFLYFLCFPCFVCTYSYAPPTALSLLRLLLSLAPYFVVTRRIKPTAIRAVLFIFSSTRTCRKLSMSRLQS